jgi:putative redox protein
MSEPKPPVRAELVWSGEQRFAATTGSTAIVLDGHGAAGPSPMQMLAIGVAGCMGIDVAAILEKGRHPLNGLRVSFSGERLPEPPRRYTAIMLHFHVTGDVPEDAVVRAIELSRTKYCSAWHSLRQDVTLTTGFTILRG